MFWVNVGVFQAEQCFLILSFSHFFEGFFNIIWSGGSEQPLGMMLWIYWLLLWMVINVCRAQCKFIIRFSQFWNFNHKLVVSWNLSIVNWKKKTIALLIINKVIFRQVIGLNVLSFSVTIFIGAILSKSRPIFFLFLATLVSLHKQKLLIFCTPLGKLTVQLPYIYIYPQKKFEEQILFLYCVLDH